MLMVGCCFSVWDNVGKKASLKFNLYLRNVFSLHLNQDLQEVEV